VGRRGSSRRAAALRRAQEAKAARDSAAALREQRIESALADYFEAVGRAEQIRADAQAKADSLLGTAEQAASEPQAVARDAVRRLRELTGSNAEVASLCGITVSSVREMLTQPAEPAAKALADPSGVSGHDW
jgi:hypothetical protein